MEKLIELLNEYEIKRKKTKMDITDKRTEWDFDNEYTQLIIISKSFWFIKWLVDNDKIDFKKHDWYNHLENPIWSNNYDVVWDYKTIIQRLSISDTPIDDLISYLK